MLQRHELIALHVLIAIKEIGCEEIALRDFNSSNAFPEAKKRIVFDSVSRGDIVTLRLPLLFWLLIDFSQVP